MELEPRYRADDAALSFLYVRSAKGELVPLSSLVNLSSGTGPLSQNHLGQIPAVTLSFNLTPGVALGDAMSSIEKVSRSVLPRSHSHQLSGNGSGVSILPAGHAAPAHHDHRRHLHHTGHPVRELHT